MCILNEKIKIKDKCMILVKKCFLLRLRRSAMFLSARDQVNVFRISHKTVIKPVCPVCDTAK